MTPEDFKTVMEPLRITLNSIDGRLSRLEKEQATTNEQLRKNADRYSELKASIQIVSNDFSGFVKRYEEQYLIIEKSVTDNYSDLTLKMKECKDNCPLNEANDNERKKYQLRNEKLRFWGFIAGFVVFIFCLVAALGIWAEQNGMIKRVGHTIELSAPGETNG